MPESGSNGDGGVGCIGVVIIVLIVLFCTGYFDSPKPTAPAPASQKQDQP